MLVGLCWLHLHAKYSFVASGNVEINVLIIVFVFSFHVMYVRVAFDLFALTAGYLVNNVHCVEYCDSLDMLLAIFCADFFFTRVTSLLDDKPLFMYSLHI